MEDAKLQFSADEMELVNNAQWILTKNLIIEKVKRILAEVYILQQEYTAGNTCDRADKIKNSNGKISRGENYNGLPYLILDYPRIFERENIFAIRTMFWWGHFISTTLHISGDWKLCFQEKICNGFTILQQHHFFISTNSDEWDHNLAGEAYLPLKNMNANTFKLKCEEQHFIKLGVYEPIGKLPDAKQIWMQQFTILYSILANYLNGEKVLSPGNPTTGFDL